MMVSIDADDVFVKKRTSCYAHSIQSALDIPCITRDLIAIDSFNDSAGDILDTLFTLVSLRS